MSDAVSSAPETAESTGASTECKPVVHLLPVTSLHPSSTKVQAERRARFSARALQELSATIRQVGILEAILVRPVPPQDGTGYEIVAGERRWRGAQNAGLDVIPATIRDLTDEQVLRLQLIENIQREELHGLAEIEAFEELVRHHGCTVEKLAREIAKPRVYVIQRLKLLSLCGPAREAYSKKKISEEIAFMLARLPVESLQREALRDALGAGSGEPMSARAFSRHIQSRYMLRLAEASFPTQDAELLPAAGPCGTCPKRTGHQPELFQDVQGADLCTDPACFAAKRAPWTARQLATAKSAGRTIIEGTAAKAIAPYGAHNLQGYVRPSDRCYDDPRQRTYRELLGKRAEPAILVVPGSGDLVEVLEKKLIAPLLKERGIGSRQKVNDPERARRTKLKRESTFRWKLFEAVRARSPAVLSRAELEQVAITAFCHHGYESRKRILKVWGWTAKNGKAYDSFQHSDVARSRIPKLSDTELCRFLLDCVFVPELYVSAWVKEDRPERLLGAAKKLGIDVDALRKESASHIDAQQKPLAEPVKAPAKKRPRKAIRKSGRRTRTTQ